MDYGSPSHALVPVVLLVEFDVHDLPKIPQNLQPQLLSNLDEAEVLNDTSALVDSDIPALNELRVLECLTISGP